MGAVCSCLNVRDTPANEDGNHRRENHQGDGCLFSSLHTIINKFRTVFTPQSRVVAPVSNQGMTSFDSLAALYASNFADESSDESPRSNPNSIFSLLRQEDEISVQKVSSHSRAQPASFRNSGVNAMAKEKNEKLLDPCDKKSENCCSNSSMSFFPSKNVESSSCHYGYSSSDDEEDVCPTCLEEYTLENPKIITKCSHHYHLSCIYEWMERSETCPVCGRIMLFDDAAN